MKDLDLRNAFSDGFAEGFIKGREDATKWIPVTKPLPKDGNRYIIYHESYGIRIDMRINGEWETYGNETVLAWMPLPDAYEVLNERRK